MTFFLHVRINIDLEGVSRLGLTATSCSPSSDGFPELQNRIPPNIEQRLLAGAAGGGYILFQCHLAGKDVFKMDFS